jgi:SpoVK/Ycf46/Vps4 family AAA+-type ATPase
VKQVEETLLPRALQDETAMIADILARGESNGLILRGTKNSGRRQFTTKLADALQMDALSVPLEVWEREPELAAACRYANWLPVLEPVLGPGEVWHLNGDATHVPIAILLSMDGAVDASFLMEMEMPLPEESERRTIWQRHLGNETLSSEIAATALLSGPAIVNLARNAHLLAERKGHDVSIDEIAESRRRLGAEQLRLLAQPVERQIQADALVLTPLLKEELDGVVQRARRRESLWKGLGITLQETRNQGVRVLFVGESGTGKTLAASYVATKLSAPLYRVDLAAVMNKYIGESEKNLAALLDHASANDVVLLFDEADSLFGRRSEGKETGERYANMLTNFLLTRIENHPGIVILTTNSRERIDAAFTRRLDAIAEFPLPGYEERLHLWQSHLGTRGPGEAIYKYLASYCDLAGGQIRNVVLTAAAASRGFGIETEHLLKALEIEYRKIGRDVPGKVRQLGHSAEQERT